MTLTWTIVALVVAMAIAWRFLGSYMAAVYEGRVRWLSWVERPIYRVCGVNPGADSTCRLRIRWVSTAGASSWSRLWDGCCW
jgi:K+-transporting ATPase A subunit